MNLPGPRARAFIQECDEWGIPRDVAAGTLAYQKAVYADALEHLATKLEAEMMKSRRLRWTWRAWRVRCALVRVKSFLTRRP